MPNETLVVEQVEEGILRLVGPLTMTTLSPFENAVRRVDGNVILDPEPCAIRGFGWAGVLGERLYFLPQNRAQHGVERCQRTCFEVARDYTAGIFVPDLSHSRRCATGTNQQRAGINPLCPVLLFDPPRQFTCRLCS